MATTVQIRDSRIDSRVVAADNSFVVDSTTTIRASNSNRCPFDSSCCRKLANRTPGSIENCSPKHGCSGLNSISLGSTGPYPLSEDSFDSSFTMGNSALLKLTYFYLESETNTCVGSKHCSLEASSHLSEIVPFAHIQEDQRRSHLLLLAGTGSIEVYMQLQGLMTKRFDMASTYSRISNSCDIHL